MSVHRARVSVHFPTNMNVHRARMLTGQGGVHRASISVHFQKCSPRHHKWSPPHQNQCPPDQTMCSLSHQNQCLPGRNKCSQGQENKCSSSHKNTCSEMDNHRKIRSTSHLEYVFQNPETSVLHTRKNSF